MGVIATFIVNMDESLLFIGINRDWLLLVVLVKCADE
jgi:hypothetical protein